MISKLVAKASVAGIAASLALTAAPSFAAAAPTLSGPADRTGYGTITLTGTATPGAAVHLYESAIIFNDLVRQPYFVIMAGVAGNRTATA